jgi:hypothetical protein
MATVIVLYLEALYYKMDNVRNVLPCLGLDAYNVMQINALNV